MSEPRWRKTNHFAEWVMRVGRDPVARVISDGPTKFDWYAVYRLKPGCIVHGVAQTLHAAKLKARKAAGV